MEDSYTAIYNYIDYIYILAPAPEVYSVCTSSHSRIVHGLCDVQSSQILVLLPGHPNPMSPPSNARRSLTNPTELWLVPAFSRTKEAT